MQDPLGRPQPPPHSWKPNRSDYTLAAIIVGIIVVVLLIGRCSQPPAVPATPSATATPTIVLVLPTYPSTVMPCSPLGCPPPTPPVRVTATVAPQLPATGNGGLVSGAGR